MHQVRAQQQGSQGHHLHQFRHSDDAAPAQQPDATTILIADEHSAPTTAPSASKTEAQQAQQWLGSISELVSYVETKAQHAGRQAQQEQHSGVHAQLAQLQAQLQQQTAQLHSQAQELTVLRAWQSNSGNPVRPSSSRGAQLYQELQQQQQEADAWCSKYQLQLQCRDIAESALQETLVVVDQLSEDCAAISGMLRNLQVLEAASAAAAAAEAGSSSTRKAAVWWLVAEIGMALLLVVCTGVATFLITRTLLQRSQ